MELYAILLALQHIPKTKHHSHIVFSDSMSSLQAVASHCTDYPVDRYRYFRLQQSLQQQSRSYFLLDPGHTGIKENFEADKAAKSASTLPITQTPLPASDFTPTIKRYINNLWQGL